MQTCLSVDSHLLGDKRASFPGKTGATNSRGISRPAFRQVRGRQRSLLASVDSQLPPAQNNPNGKAAYFAVAYSDPLQ